MNDLQLARGNVPGGYNLAVGEPEILQDLLAPCLPYYPIHGIQSYPTLEGDPKLVAEIQRLHPDHEVVVTCGAKQGLLASFWACQKVLGCQWVQTTRPYWLSLPTLAKLAGLKFDDQCRLFLQEQVDLNVSPNNPDGSVSLARCTVWDSVYAHPVYGWVNDLAPHYRIRVCSASKSLGLSGLRVGWLVTRDRVLAAAARTYVECTTSGVPWATQRYLANALCRVREDFDGRIAAAYAEARRRLLENAATFREIMGPYLADIEAPPATSGMFAWAHPKLPAAFDVALAAAKVAVARGEAFGGLGCYRFSLMARDLRTPLLKIVENLK